MDVNSVAEHGPPNKRCKQSADVSFQSNILDEPSPLNLILTKSPSFLDLIETELFQRKSVNANTSNFNSEVKKQSQASIEKLQASNFPGFIIFNEFNLCQCCLYCSTSQNMKVTWWQSKFCFAKKKIVWEVLVAELKSKIEIQRSDITELKTNCPNDGPSSLSLVVARQPLFFRETNPQPRKHTLWQSTTGFTGGQANIHMRHFLQCEQGHLIKHFEQLIQCSEHLKFLSKQPEIMLDSPHFDTRSAASENPDIPKDCDLHKVNGKESTSRFQNMGSAHSSPSPSFRIERGIPSAITLDSVPCEEMGSGSSSLFVGGLECEKMLEDLLIDDNQVAFGEISLLPKVNSLGCLQQMDHAAASNSHNNTSYVEGPNDGKHIQLSHDLESMQGNGIQIDMQAAEEEWRDVYDDNLESGMFRKYSFGDLLFNLPQIASLPKFLFNMSQD